MTQAKNNFGLCHIFCLLLEKLVYNVNIGWLLRTEVHIMATKLNIDGVTYQIRKDPNGPAKANYDIRAGYPLNYITDYMSNSAVMNVAKSLRQLGYTVVDMRTA